MPRRARGALEAEVLGILWACDEPLSPEQVRAHLGGDLAYTTVMTILVRLYEKGTLVRTAAGRGFAYTPAFDETGLAAERMRTVLAHESDHHAVLGRFVDALEPDDLDALRQSLRQSQRRRRS